MTLLGLLGGALLGMLGGFGGALFGALLGAACGAFFDLHRASQRRARTAGLEARLTRLEGEVQALQRALREPDAAANVPNSSGEILITTGAFDGVQPPEEPPSPYVPSEPSTPPLTDQPTAYAEASVEVPTAQVFAHQTPTDQVPTEQVPTEHPIGRPSVAQPVTTGEIPPRRPPPPGSFSPGDSLRRGLARLVGSNALAKLGVLVLVIGLALLVQYAAGRGYFPLELRLGLVALTGLGLALLGWRLRVARPPYALSLEGGGVGVMYLAVFGSLRYDLIPAPLGFVLLTALAVVAALLAVLQNAQSLAVLGLLGGFLAPVFAADGPGDPLVLLGYYFALNVGVLVVAWFRSWRLLNLLGFGFTLGFGAFWGTFSYEPRLFRLTETFLVLFFLLYLSVSVRYAFRQPPRLRGLVDGTLVFGLPLAVLPLQAALVAPFAFGLAWSALALGALYLGLAWLLVRRAPPPMRVLAEAFVGVGLGFVTLTLPFALTNAWTGTGWALEGAALVWLGLRQRRRWVRGVGAALQPFAAAAFLLDGLNSALSEPLFAFGAALLAGSSLVSAYWLWRYRDRLRPPEAPLGPLLLSAGLAWWAVAGFAALRLTLPERLEADALLVFAALTALFCTLGSRRLRWPALALPALALLPLLGLRLFGVTLSGPAHPLDGLGWVAWPLACVSCAWILYRTPALTKPILTEKSARSLDALLNVLHAAQLWVLALAVGLELTWWGGRVGPGWAVVGCGLAFAAVLLVMTLPAVRDRPWFRARRTVTLTLGLAPVAAALGLWAVLSNLSASGNARPLAYLPLLNPLDLTQAAGLVALAFWCLTLGREGVWAHARRPLVWALLLLGVLWLSAVVVRTAHHWTGVPFSFPALFGLGALQTALTIFWTAFALPLMLVAARRGRRSVWLLGAGLLAFAVLKLFLVDLAQVGTVARIVSFVGVGVLLLLTAYLAPVPPKAEPAAQP